MSALPLLVRLLAAGCALCLAVATPACAEEPVGGARLGGRGVILPAGAPALPAAVVARAWLVADLDSGAVLAAADPHARYAPASTLKTLTALTLIPRLDRNRKVVPTYDDLAVDGSKVGLVEHVGYPVHELFSAMLMVSGNDAANTLASAAGGPIAIREMNDQARRLQALDTHAVNPSGLDAPGQVSSAYDLALIARAAMRLPDFRRYVATVHDSISGPGHQRIEMLNHDKLLRRYPGALGIKNGYTTSAQASFIGAARRNGRTLLVVLLRTRPQVDREAAALLDWGFAASAAGVSPVGQLVDPVDAQAGSPVPQALVAQAPALPLRHAASTSGAGDVPLGLASAGTVVGAAVLLRRRRRRLRY